MVKNWLYASGPSSVVLRPRELRPHHRRLDPAQQEEPERRDEVAQADRLVVHAAGASPGSPAGAAQVRSSWPPLPRGGRRATRLATGRARRLALTGGSPGRRASAWRSAELSCVGGILAPGLMRLRVDDPARQVPARVRQRAGRDGAPAGEMREIGSDPASRPACRRWRGTSRSARRGNSAGRGARGCRSASRPCRAAASASARSRRAARRPPESAMLACCRPQNSAHWPRYTPGASRPGARGCSPGRESGRACRSGSAARSCG